MPVRKQTPRLQTVTPSSKANHDFKADDVFFHQLLESLEDYVIFTTDIKGQVNTWNKGAQKIFGYAEEEILGKSAEILYTPEDRKAKKPTKELEIAAQRGRAINERWHVRKDGTRFWGSGVVFPLRDEQKNIQGFTKVMRDLTERIEGIQQIQQREERYRAFIMYSSEGIWRFELEQPVKITTSLKKQIDHFYQYAYLAECNDSMAKMYGFKKAVDIIGMRLEDFLIPNNKQNIAYLTAFIQSGYRLTEIESHEKDKLGNDKYFLNNLIGYLEDGYLVRAWGTQRDITEQKKALASFTRLADIVESSQDSILSRTLDGRILSWNKGAEKMYGYTAEEAMHQDISITIPKDRIHEARMIIDAIKNGEQITHFETVRSRKDGSLLDVSISVSPIKNAEGTLIGISTIARDITEMKSLQRQKDDFIGIASHELKTPVTSIKAYTQLLENRFAKKGDETSYDLLSKMDTQIDKLNNLIGDLLDVTKIESGKMHFNQAYFDFNELVGEIVEEMQRTTVQHSIQKKLGKSKSIYGDRDRIGQVIMNLLSNAIKYSPDADKIVVSSEFDAEHLTFCVRDSGVGIPKEKQIHVFDRFFRVSGPNQNTFPGMGLGLYISSEIIKRQGGKIWVKSYTGKGSTFCFSLPLMRPAKRNTAQHRE